MKKDSRDNARDLIHEAGITDRNVTKEQLDLLHECLTSCLFKSGNYNHSFRMNGEEGNKFMTCKTNMWKEREAVSFNNDGFIGFAGWADSNNIKPILEGVYLWIKFIKGKNYEKI